MRTISSNLKLLAAAVLCWSVLSPAALVANGAEDPGSSWPHVSLADPKSVELGGPAGVELERGVKRLSQLPYTADWLLADVSFKVNRIFTNYSGDVSGRFLELASLTKDLSPTATLQPVMAEITRYQRADGHFGGEMDFSQPMQKLSPPIPMLWGNARLLVGLVTAAREYHDSRLLAAARRLGDFYINTTNVFCSPAREKELRATGTGGDGYTCCYFPAIEGLALLYRDTHALPYLEQGRRMAEWFMRFDALPVDHSHGNLCAWRGILELYHFTRERVWLERAIEKWEKAVRGGYVWPIGGVGEHWYIFHPGDEGCSESDWLRFNLELWRYTGETRYLDIADRLLRNQYSGNQCPNGGYGWRNFDGDAAGPSGTRGQVQEWNFCCSFHGPLGLHFLKAYLAAGSERGVFVNFPMDFSSRVNSSGQCWRVTMRSPAGMTELRRAFELELIPLMPDRPARTRLWLRMPQGVTNLRIVGSSGTELPFTLQDGYACLESEFEAGQKFRITFDTPLRLEARKFKPVALEGGQIRQFHDVAFVQGQDVLFATPAPVPKPMALLAQMDSAGQLELWRSPKGDYVSVELPSPEAGLEEVLTALKSARAVLLRPESELRSVRRAAFMNNVVVVPADQLPASTGEQLVQRARQAEEALRGQFFGEHLERSADLWDVGGGWQFGSNTLHVTGGDIGLLGGEDYSDYRFEFDVQLPMGGQGVTGWVVRAKGLDDCVMFQVQTADSPYNAPEFKTRPNTLRPHVRRGGQWTIADPVLLPKEVRRGVVHHIAVECRGATVAVSLDGEKIYSKNDLEMNAGTVGFRATGPGEQGLFSNVCLRKL